MDFPNNTATHEASGTGELLTPVVPPQRIRAIAQWLIRHFLVERLLIAVLLVIAWKAGIAIREWTWDHSGDIQWKSNIGNAFTWGTRVLDGVDRQQRGGTNWAAIWAGYRTLYDDVEGDESFRNGMLDYAPMRLLVNALWVRHIRLENPMARRWRQADGWFLLNLNTAATVIGAVAAFLLVRHWRRAEVCDEPISRRRVVIDGACALTAALLLWFNAAAVLEGYAWPQWDIWPVPFFLLAAWCGSTNRWARAGALIAMGALFKGQILFVAPFLMLWPLFQARVVPVVRFIIGFAFVGTLVGSIWLVHGWGMGTLVYGTALVAAIATVWLQRRRPWRFRLRSSLTVAAAAFALAVVLVGRFDSAASMAWFRVSYMVGTEKYPLLARNCACNLPAILNQTFNWGLTDPVFASSTSGGMEIRTLLATSYFLTLIASAAAGAWQAARRSRFFLIAIALPWVLLFTLMPQMDGRYLLYGAVVSCVFAGVNVGLTLLHLLLTGMNFAMMFKFLIKNHADDWPTATRWLEPIEPSMGWALMVIAAILLYCAFLPPFRSLSHRELCTKSRSHT